MEFFEDRKMMIFMIHSKSWKQKSVKFCYVLFCPLKLMAVGVSGVNGIFVLNQWMACKPGAETVSTLNQNMGATAAMEPGLL